MKKIIFIISLIVCFFLYLVVINLSNNERDILENSTNDQIIKSNALTMMYETDVGSGEYQLSTDSEWLGDEYIFNETLSKCENGSTLTWDDENKKVLMQANTSDKCYVYFDKYNFVTIKSVDATEITSDSITVSVNAIPGDGEIVSYHYSINEGGYISSTNNIYTFENLEAETSYDISIYIIDSNGRKASYTKNGVITLNSPTILYVEIYETSPPSVVLNSYYLKNGDNIAFNVGDTLQIIPALSIGSVSFYNKSDELVASLSINSCNSLQYVLTGEESKIIIQGYNFSGALVPEKCK